MKCPKCVEEGKKSTLHGGHGMVTALYCPSYYDEEGVYHHHDMNTTTSSYHCSNGHKMIIRTKPSCPSYPENCDHSGTEDIEIIEENK